MGKNHDDWIAPASNGALLGRVHFGRQDEIHRAEPALVPPSRNQAGRPGPNTSIILGRYEGWEAEVTVPFLERVSPVRAIAVCASGEDMKSCQT